MKPFITIVMPVRNEARFIRSTLMQLLTQNYPSDRIEIIVADGMSDDGTQDIVAELARTYPQVRLLENQKKRSGAGRNVGFQNGQGDYFLVIDGHCFIPDDQFLLNIAECFDKSGADCLGRPQPLDPPGLTVFQQAVALARGSKLGHGGDSLIYGQFEGYSSPVSNGAGYRRRVFETIGYVDEDFDACEDVEFNYRLEKAGLKAYTSPKLTVRYFPRECLKGLFRQMVRYGRGRCRFVRKHPEALTVNQLVPVAFVGGLLLAFGGVFSLVPVSWLPIFRPRAMIAFPLVSIYVIYLMLTVAESIRISVRDGWRYLPYLPLIFLTVHFGLGYGFIFEALKTIRPGIKETHKLRETEPQCFSDSVTP